jgi:hypothetical protein
MCLKAPGQASECPSVNMGFLSENNKIAKGFYLLKEFKMSIFRFV